MQPNAHANDNTPSNVDTIAVFDFDGTVTQYHSFWRFVMANTSITKKLAGTGLIVRLLFDIKIKKKPLMLAREEFVRFFLRGFDAQKWRDKATTFALEQLPQWITPEAKARIEWHQSQGHRLALVSNSPVDYLVPWAKLYGFEHVAGSQFAEHNGQLTGEMQGNHCFGPEKVNQLEALINERANTIVYAYGDSVGDRELLQYADFAFYRNFSTPGNLPW